MRSRLLLLLKGMAMGAANVIPGVSGGTIAFITGIYETFIESLKSFDLKALKLLSRFKLIEFSAHVNLPFLLVLGAGIIISLLSLGKLLDYLFGEYPVYVWSFFFGLIAISVISVGRTVRRFSFQAIFWFAIGASLAAALALMNPASEDSGFLYLVICGVVAIASMILPGLSGSFVLILMGNYRLIMLRAVPDLEWQILFPVGIGAILGFILLSRIISWFLKHHHDAIISLLTGFILGSLLIIWPWKQELLLRDVSGELVLKNGQSVVSGYEWFIPGLTIETAIAGFFILIGIFLVVFIERIASKNDA